jgi:hypothetical protein
MEGKIKTTRSPLHKTKKTSERFRPFNYLNTYTKETSNMFNERITLLYTMVVDYKRNKHNARWAKCCFCFEGRVAKGNLNHPEEEMINIKDLMAQEQIDSEADMLAFMKRTLPRNEDGEILLPQINMKHSTAIPVNPEIEILKEKLAQVEDESGLLKVVVEQKNQQADEDSKISLYLNEQRFDLEEKLAAAERNG